MSNHYENYKKAADEYYSMYTAFRNAGFFQDQAFELVKAFCTSAAMQNMLENLRLTRTRDKHTNLMRRYMNEQIKKEDEEDKT